MQAIKSDTSNVICIERTASIARVDYTGLFVLLASFDVLIIFFFTVY